MAEKSSELKNADRLDPIAPDSTTRGGNDEFLERYADDASDREFVGDKPEDTEQIKAQIVETRKGMGETIDAIQERLSLSNISDQVSETVNNAIESAKDTAYDATIGKAVNFMKNVGDGVTHSGAFRTVKNNPFPLALIGLGTGLLVYQSYSRKGARYGNGKYGRKLYNNRESSGYGERAGDVSTGGSIGNMSSRAYEGISDKASSALDTVSNTAGSAYESVSGAVNTAYTKADDLARRAYDGAGEIGTIATEKYDQYLEENPLALGALAVAVGAAVGFAIPSTRYEGELMGETRETLVQRAQDAAGSLVDKAKQVANEAGQTIKQETQSLTK